MFYTITGDSFEFSYEYTIQHSIPWVSASTFSEGIDRFIYFSFSV